MVGFGTTADPRETRTADPLRAVARADLCEVRTTDAPTAGEHVDRREARATEPKPDPPCGREGRPPREKAPLWADLMRRTFGLDTLACPNCGGRLRLIALIEEAAVIARILRHLHLPTEVPTPRPGRAPPLLDADSFNQDTDAAGCNSCA